MDSASADYAKAKDFVETKLPAVAAELEGLSANPAVAAVLAAVQGMFQRSTADGVEPHQHYPKRYEFLERSCMGREMDRL